MSEGFGIMRSTRVPTMSAPAPIAVIHATPPRIQNLPFGQYCQMLSEIYWIEADGTAKLAIMARPRAGDWLEDEVKHWKRSGVEVVVSLLETQEIEDLGLQLEAPLCLRNGIELLFFPIPDRGVPDDVNGALRFASDLGRSGKALAIHCRAGIGRSSIMAAAILVSRGIGAEAALSAISAARRTQVPDTDAQREWVLSLERR